MERHTPTSWLDHPSYAVDALLIFIMLLGGLLLIGWAAQPSASTATFDMQLIPDSAVVTESSAARDAATLGQELTTASHPDNL